MIFDVIICKIIIKLSCEIRFDITQFNCNPCKSAPTAPAVPVSPLQSTGTIASHFSTPHNALVINNKAIVIILILIGSFGWKVALLMSEKCQNTVLEFPER